MGDNSILESKKNISSGRKIDLDTKNDFNWNLHDNMFIKKKNDLVNDINFYIRITGLMENWKKTAFCLKQLICLDVTDIRVVWNRLRVGTFDRWNCSDCVGYERISISNWPNDADELTSGEFIASKYHVSWPEAIVCKSLRFLRLPRYINCGQIPLCGRTKRIATLHGAIINDQANWVGLIASMITIRARYGCVVRQIYAH